MFLLFGCVSSLPLGGDVSFCWFDFLFGKAINELSLSLVLFLSFGGECFFAFLFVTGMKPMSSSRLYACAPIDAAAGSVIWMSFSCVG